MLAASIFSSENVTKRVDACVERSVGYSYNVLYTFIHILQFIFSFGLVLNLFITLYRVFLNWFTIHCTSVTK